MDAETTGPAVSQPNGRFSRVARLLGDDAMRRLSTARVVVIGLGAVGGYAVEGLARSGVGRFKLVDFDRVQLSNINRQLGALESTLGRQKTAVTRDRVLDINPDCDVDTCDLFAHVETFERIFTGQIDVVIDAIDSVTPKLSLLEELGRRGLPTVSSMGAALRRDPTKVRVARLSKTRDCALARVMRRGLRKRDSAFDPLCVYSVEPMHDTPEDAIASEEESDTDILKRGRPRRALGSLPTVTGIFGLTVANAALEMLLSADRAS